MAFDVGTRVGPYEILGKLGAGGMGEVFRAHDSRLDRDVALKVLPPAFGQDAERVARFEREAKAIAALSHPNILAIFDTGRHTGLASESALYVVTELLEGETLRDRLAQGALPVRKALDIAVQIARGLGAAHDKGLVHRDLKPENIFLLPDGRAKILDFGLARQVTMGTGSGATQTVAAVTDPGMVMGTVGYMAPEQVRGLPVDGRSDVFAFGGVLYEMLTGTRAFLRETAAETMTAILNEEPPDLLKINPGVPPAVDRIVRHCLEKQPGERFQSARDAAFALESLSASGSSPVAVPVTDRNRWRSRLSVAAAFGAVAALSWSAGYFGADRPATDAASVALFDVALPEGDEFRLINSALNLAQSSDGRTLYYIAQRNGVSQVFRRRQDSSQTEPVAGTEGAQQVFAYPNDEGLAFTSPAPVLRRIAATGGPSTVIAKASSAILGIAASSDGEILFGTHSSGLFRIPQGGDPVVIVPVSDLGPPRFPATLPAGKGLLFTVGGVPVSNRIAVLPRGETTPRVLTTGTDAIYVETGHLMFWRDGGLWAAPFDLTSLTLSGAAVPVLDNVAVHGTGSAAYSLASNGTLAYVEALPSPERTLVWVDQRGQETPLKTRPGPYAIARLSPDNTRAVLAYRTDATEDLWMHDIDRGVTEPFLNEPASEWAADWTADGGRVVFTSRREGPFRLFAKRSNGLGDIEPLLNKELVANILGRAPDGRMLMTMARSLSLIDLVSQTAEPLWSEPGVHNARISPDGKWIAYSAGFGTAQVWVRPYPAVETDRWRVSIEGGSEPRWSVDSRTLYYRHEQAMMAVNVRPGTTFTHGPPKLLFEGPYQTDFDIARDGRFLMIKQSSNERAHKNRIVIALNWLTEFKSKLGR